jgi:hypothetical protein
VIELTTIQVAQSEMREVQIGHRPSRAVFRRPIHALPEERQLKSKFVSIHTTPR